MHKLSLIFVFFLITGAHSKNENQSSQDILQSNGSARRPTKRASRCSAEPLKSAEKQFKDYVQKFSKSEPGKLLKDIMAGESVTKLSEPITKLLDKSHIEKLNQIVKEPTDRTWNLVSLGISGLYAIVLAYMTVMAPLSTYTTLTIGSYVMCSVVLGLCHDLVPLWVVAMFGVFGDLLVIFLLSFLDNIKRRQICVLSVCLVFSKMVYDIHAVVPLDFISPSYTGISGLIVNYVFRSSSFVLLRVWYLVFLIFVTSSLFLKLPSFVAGEPMELQEIDVGSTIMKRLICFVAGLPAAGACTQVFTWIRKTINPIGPFTFFVVPTRLRLTKLETYLGITLWVIFSVAYYQMIKNSNENRLLTPPKKRRSWRAYTRTISRI